MATRSRIGIELSDGSILSAYHHWDGYPEWLGRILRTHYNTKELVSELIDGGDMSTCWDEDNKPAYYAMRGDICPPRLDKDLNEYLCDSEEFSYVFTDKGWVCYANDYRGVDLVKEVEIPSGALMA